MKFGRGYFKSTNFRRQTSAARNFELVSKNCINNYTTRYCNANNELFYHAVIVFTDIVTFHKQYDDYDPN